MTEKKNPGGDRGGIKGENMQRNKGNHTPNADGAEGGEFQAVPFRIEHLEELQEIAKGLAAAPVIESSDREATADFLRFLRAWSTFAAAVHQSDDFSAELEVLLAAWNALLPRLAKGDIRTVYLGRWLPK